MHPRVVMELLGHRQIAVTMKYSHMLPALRREAANQMDAVLKTPQPVATKTPLSAPN